MVIDGNADESEITELLSLFRDMSSMFANYPGVRELGQYASGGRDLHFLFGLPGHGLHHDGFHSAQQHNCGQSLHKGTVLHHSRRNSAELRHHISPGGETHADHVLHGEPNQATSQSLGKMTQILH
jgi:hypothetical protein